MQSAKAPLYIQPEIKHENKSRDIFAPSHSGIHAKSGERCPESQHLKMNPYPQSAVQ